jgi:hypothetical protein
VARLGLQAVAISGLSRIDRFPNSHAECGGPVFGADLGTRLDVMTGADDGAAVCSILARLDLDSRTQIGRALAARDTPGSDRSATARSD